MPNKRDIPDIWYSGDEVRQAWQDTNAKLFKDWTCRTTFTVLRIAPRAACHGLVLRGLNKIPDKPAASNCTTRGWLGAMHYVMEWYIKKGLGRPAFGFVMQHESDEHGDARHAVGWGLDESGIWIADTDTNVYIPGSDETYEWAVC